MSSAHHISDRSIKAPAVKIVGWDLCITFPPQKYFQDSCVSKTVCLFLVSLYLFSLLGNIPGTLSKKTDFTFSILKNNFRICKLHNHFKIRNIFRLMQSVVCRIYAVLYQCFDGD